MPPSFHRTPCALTIGNFDGVHQGHLALLKKLQIQANQLQVQTCVLTFEPHPKEFFDPANAPARILNLRDKLEKDIKLVQKSGLVWLDRGGGVRTMIENHGFRLAA